jgi:hypothetical protein
MARDVPLNEAPRAYARRKEEAVGRRATCDLDQLERDVPLRVLLELDIRAFDGWIAFLEDKEATVPRKRG